MLPFSVNLNINLDGEKLMATLQDLANAVTSLTQAVNDHGTAVSTLESTVAQLRASGALSAVDQTTLDNAVAQVTQSVATLNQETQGAQATLASSPAATPTAATPTAAGTDTSGATGGAATAPAAGTAVSGTALDQTATAAGTAGAGTPGGAPPAQNTGL